MVDRSELHTGMTVWTHHGEKLGQVTEVTDEGRVITLAGRPDQKFHPDEITRVKALFDRRGLFVWHCHILEHEDNEMMRPYRIGPDVLSARR